MPVWRGEGDFLTLLKADKDVSAKLSAKELEDLFDLGLPPQACGYDLQACVWGGMNCVIGRLFDFQD